LWKGATKYAGLGVIAAFAGVGILHHLVMGPNKVTREDEQNAKSLTERRP
jgi:formate dehydrogenase iron-sulfur subunit